MGSHHLLRLCVTPGAKPGHFQRLQVVVVVGVDTSPCPTVGAGVGTNEFSSLDRVTNGPVGLRLNRMSVDPSLVVLLVALGVGLLPRSVVGGAMFNRSGPVVGVFDRRARPAAWPQAVDAELVLAKCRERLDLAAFCAPLFRLHLRNASRFVL